MFHDETLKKKVFIEKSGKYNNAILLSKESFFLFGIFLTLLMMGGS